MIRLNVALASGGARLTAAFYQPLSCCHASCGIGGSAPSNASTSSPAVFTLLFLSPLRLVAISWLSLQILDWYFVFRRAETLSLTSLHVSSKIYPFFLFSLACGFSTALRRSAKMPSSCVGSAGVRSGSCLRPERYLMCYLSGALCRQPNAM